MAKSAAFRRIRSEVLEMTRRIPPGQVSTYPAIGRQLDVMARHVAYILATLDAEEADSVPWFRVVAAGGLISRANPERCQIQIGLLQAEGIQLTASGVLVNLDSTEHVF